MTPNNLPSLAPIVPPLLDWYAASARVLPWRSDPTPYRVWVSEIMLQQTRVEAVKPYFERFMAALPDIPALAAVEEDTLLKLWEGLGYYSRARNLKKAAQLLCERHGGQLPASVEALCALPGIGPYTAGAIASIAFGIPAPAVDGNVLRVVSRILAYEADIATPAAKTAITQAVAAVIPEGHAGAFTQALMELGAMVCLPVGAAHCADCPVRMHCEGHRRDMVDRLPVKAPKKPRRVEHKTVFVLYDGPRTALRKRKAGGLLGGMWELPNADGELTPDQAEEVLAQWGIRGALTSLPAAKHIFTHVEWHMVGYRVQVTQILENPHLVWVEKQALSEQYALPTAFRAYMPFANR